MTDLLAQVRLTRPSGLPEDVIVNTFAFVGNAGTTHQGMHDELVGPLNTFYGSWASYRAADFVTSAELRTYDFADPEPREPIISALTVTGTSSGNPFPAEVACCLSYYASRNLPRRRGRLYLGPLTSSAMNIATDEPRVSTTFMNVILDAAEAFQDDITTSTVGEAMGWAVHSRSDGVFRQITDLWMDNAFDTQRRRGVSASNRLTRDLVA